MSVKNDPCHAKDKLALFCLAGFVVAVLGAIVVGVFWAKVVPDKGDVLLGGVATGLILFLRDLVQAVRTSWEEVTRAETNKQLAGSGPPKLPSAPQTAVDAADQVAGAAADAADRIGEKP